MQEPRYEAPQNLEHALELLAGDDPGRSRVLAGGTDLLVQMTSGLRSPELVLDVKRIPELSALRFDVDGTTHLGAATCAAEIAESERFRALFPGLAEAIGLIGSDQIQGRASVGGNLCNGSPAADTVPALLALGARCHVRATGGRSRTIPVAEFVVGPGQTALEPGELLVELEIPAPPPRSGDAYLRMIPRTEMDIAIAGAAVRVVLDASGICTEATVALGAVAPTAILAPAAAEALCGTPIDSAALERAGGAARAACRPIDDKRGTVEYRTRMAGVLTVRAARKAAERARER